MTTKRFTMKGSTIFENGEEITAWDCYDLLNEQHETIQRLKQNIDKLILLDIKEELLKENEQLRKDIARYRGNFREMEDVKCELAEENEQLKKDIEYYKTERLALFEYLDKKDEMTNIDNEELFYWLLMFSFVAMMYITIILAWGV